MKRILVVDNDEPARWRWPPFFETRGTRLMRRRARSRPCNAWSKASPDLVVTDLCAPDCLCVGLLNWIREHFTHLDVIVVTAFGSIDCVVKTIKMGALNYVMKPVNNGKFLRDRPRCPAPSRTRSEVPSPGQRAPYCYLVDEVVGVSRSMEQVLQTALRVSDVDSGILIHGESGTGKELIARILHNAAAPGATEAFVAVNCAALPDEILESELFGYVRGAFTGATQPARGVLRWPTGGRCSWTRSATPHRSSSPSCCGYPGKGDPAGGRHGVRSVDVRIVAATNRDIKRMIGEGTFREDLYYRLSVIDIVMPPLRERKEDILPLVDYFLQEINERLGTEVWASPRRPWPC